MSSETTVQSEVVEVARQPYAPPAVMHELTLETRAGSPLGGGLGVDPLGLDPNQPQ